MSKRTISVPIDCEDETCGQCMNLGCSDSSSRQDSMWKCNQSEFGKNMPSGDHQAPSLQPRLEECIKGEQWIEDYAKYCLNLGKLSKAEHKEKE